MTQPPPYSRQWNFTDFSRDKPDTPHSGVALDQEFNSVLFTLAAVLANIALIQRDDGALRNNTVSLATLAPDTLLTLGAGSQWTPKGAWDPAKAYVASDVVTNGTATYVVSEAHTSAALIATDVAAGRLQLLFDSAGSIPADNSVTTPKLVNGAVTSAKITEGTVSLVGAVISAVGFAVGTGSILEAFHAKRAGQSVRIHLERSVAADGVAGLKITPVANKSWDFTCAAGSLDLTLASADGQVYALFREAHAPRLPSGYIVTGTSAFVGAGIAKSFSGGVGNVSVYDYTASEWRDLNTRALVHRLFCSGVEIAEVNDRGLEVLGGVFVNGKDTRDLAQNSKTASYALTPDDRDGHVLMNAAGATTITIPNSNTFPIGSQIAILNIGAGICSIAPAAGAILLRTGTGASGMRSLAQHGLVALIKVSATTWYISGSGLS